ncbi:MAG: type IV pilin-like G/H family protein [Cyanobacteria bacterium P01_H01_bin.121]
MAGFTLIELLVVIIILGILASIALPSFLSQRSKARQSEAKIYVTSMNRAQAAYLMEENSFATDINSLDLGLPASTNNYQYEIVLDNDLINNKATPQDATTKGYAGVVGSLPQGVTMVLCEADQVGDSTPGNGTSTTDALNCPTSFTQVN